MNPSYTPFVWIGAIILAGGLLIVGIRSFGPAEPVPENAAEPVSQAVQSTHPAAPASPPDLSSPAATLPWAQAAGAVGNAAQPASLPGQSPLPALSQQDVAAALVNIRQQSQHNTAMADSLLKELEQLERSGNAPPGVNIEALRTNLGIAKRAQVLALELAESTQHPESEARQRRNEAIIAELQALQGKLRYDVNNVPAGAGAPARTQ